MNRPQRLHSPSRRPRAAAVACLGVLAALAGRGVAAHHSFSAEFDVKRPIELKGKVTKVELINPHSWIHLEVTDDAGQHVAWMIEGGSPNALFKKGVTKNSIPLGSELVVKGYQARDGSHRAVGRDIAFADGRPLFFASSRPEPAP